MPASLPPDVSAQTNLFGRLLTQGTLYRAGMQLSNFAVVLPFICAHQGIIWAAGLLFPAYSIGSIVGSSISPAILRRAGQLRHLLLSAILGSAAALVVLDAVVPWTGIFVAAVFLLTCAASGVLVAVSCVAYSEVVSSKVCVLRRSELLLSQGAIGSALATAVTLLVVPALAHGDEMAYYHDLLWLGAAGLVAASIAALFIGPVRHTSATTQMPMRETYRQGFAVARSQPWFRRYAMTFLLFAPISLSTTFYTLRTAKQSGSLHVLVILSSIGLFIGAALWRKVYRLSGVRGMLLGSALLSAAAALLCIVAESCGQWFHLWAYGTVFLLATVAGQAIFAASVSWISAVAAEQHRATLIGFASTLVAIESTVLGVVLAGIAQKHSTSWPVVIVLALAVLAAVAAVSAPARDGGATHDRPSRPQPGKPRLVVLEVIDAATCIQRQPKPLRLAQAAVAAA